jgi:ribosomal protein S18 acetylase RimI-like enzyme
MAVSPGSLTFPETQRGTRNDDRAPRRANERDSQSLTRRRARGGLSLSNPRSPPEGQEAIETAHTEPRLTKYWENWGGPGDASSPNKIVALAWVRVLSDEAAQRCSPSDTIPELAIAVETEYRNAGIGQLVLERLIHDLRGRKAAGICLSVRSESRAVRLYERLSFAVPSGAEMTNRIGTQSLVMYLKLQQEGPARP